VNLDPPGLTSRNRPSRSYSLNGFCPGLVSRSEFEPPSFDGSARNPALLFRHTFRNGDPRSYPSLLRIILPVLLLVDPLLTLQNLLHELKRVARRLAIAEGILNRLGTRMDLRSKDGSSSPNLDLLLLDIAIKSTDPRGEVLHKSRTKFRNS
jgi:hypothetical protein